MVDTLSVLIVGCGQIAGGFDAPGARKEKLTHASAITADPRFDLVACVDSDEAAMVEFANNWNVPNKFSNIELALKSLKSLDVVVVSTPTECHFDNLMTILDDPPKLVFTEKPVTNESAETLQVLERAKETSTKICVNYTRRWDPVIRELKKSWDSFGEVRSVVCFYNKGLLNNGTHMLDLLDYLLGDMTVVAVGQPLNDWKATDRSIPAMLVSHEQIPVQLVVGDARDFSLFEMQIIASNGIWTMKDGGSYWWIERSVESKRYIGYRSLGAPEVLAGGYDEAFVAAYDNLFEAVVENIPLNSTVESAMRSQILAEEILQKKSKG